MTISVVIPTLNEAKTLPALLALLQPYRDQLELIVSDGGSDDGTEAIAKPYVDCVCRGDKGRAKQMNAGAAIAQGEVLWFLHADTVLLAPIPDYIKVLNHLTKRQPWGFFKLRLSSKAWVFSCIAWMISWRSRLQGIGTGDQAMFVRADVFKPLGGFADMALMEDIALSKTLKALCRPYVPALYVQTSSRRWQQKGVFKTILLMWRLRLAYALGVSPETLVKRYYPNDK